MDAKTPLRSLVYGGLSCAAADAVTIPLDVVKVRMQLQGEGGHRQYRSALDAVVKIARREGPLAFTKGLAPAVLRQLSYGSLRFGLYSICKQRLGVSSQNAASSAVFSRLAAGVFAGSTAAFICNPIDLIKIRMQADGMRAIGQVPPSYRGVTDGVVSIVRNEGWRGLWKGAIPGATRAGVVNMAEIAAYDEIKSLVLRQNLMSEGLQLHLATAMITGFLSTLASCPFDVVKSRLMSQPFDDRGVGLRYRGMGDCFVKCFRAEGLPFLWRGFGPCYANKGPTVVILFLTYEQLRTQGDRWLDGPSRNVEHTLGQYVRRRRHADEVSNAGLASVFDSA
eukprot:TRINITY_DN5542_c0_g1_i2.p1 TRINITY_DN5542_c0_g1~~TRINITY_DN5542_c0_g1_i2.p1  ORF type:complete len:393 (+),score=51.33 TRINITY_DN5542_c0_g1_i2:171-1181(+)